MARAIGAPMTVIGTIVKSTIGISSPGIRTDSLRCVDARRGQGETNLGSIAHRATRVDRAIVCEHGLPGDRANARQDLHCRARQQRRLRRYYGAVLGRAVSFSRK